MAIRQFTVDYSISPNGSAIVATWGALSNGDVGAPLRFAEYSDKTFSAGGTFGAAGSVAIQGSNDGVTWWSLSNRQGTPMAFTAPAGNTSQDRPVYVRPAVTAGDGTTAIVIQAACHHSDVSPIGGG